MLMDNNSIINLIFQLEEYCRLDPKWRNQLIKVNEIYERYGDNLSYMETGENLKSVLDDMEYYKKKYGGDISVGWCNADNPEAFVGYIFVKNDEIIGIEPYM